jgi:hypothetical protein
VNVVVPRILVAGRLVVLPGGNAFAPAGVANGDRDLSDGIVNGVAVGRRQVVEILMVLGRHYQYMSAVVRPPA